LFSVRNMFFSVAARPDLNPQLPDLAAKVGDLPGIRVLRFDSTVTPTKSQNRHWTVGAMIRETALISRVEEYQQKAELCEDLALQAKDAEVKIALMEAARQWRGRASLLAQHEDDRLPAAQA
jgi:hypothetical protein